MFEGCIKCEDSSEFQNHGRALGTSTAHRQCHGSALGTSVTQAHQGMHTAPPHLQLPQGVHPPLSLPLAPSELQHLLLAPVCSRLCVGSSSGRSRGQLQGLLELRLVLLQGLVGTGNSCSDLRVRQPPEQVTCLPCIRRQYAGMHSGCMLVLRQLRRVPAAHQHAFSPHLHALKGAKLWSIHC